MEDEKQELIQNYENVIDEIQKEKEDRHETASQLSESCTVLSKERQDMYDENMALKKFISDQEENQIKLIQEKEALY